MTVSFAPPAIGRDVAVQGPDYVTVLIHGGGIAEETVTRMLAGENGECPRVLRPGESVPVGAQPVLVGETTVYSAVRIEEMLRAWHPQVPRPWVVLVCDAPLATPKAARYRLRALEQRLYGIAVVKYLPVLRTVEHPDDAMDDKTVQAEAVRLRRVLGGDK
jgi:hypothetical protein